MESAQLEAIARDCRIQIIRMLTHAGSGHPEDRCPSSTW